ncbi:MAG: ROK family protein [Bacteroidota bacterium]
MSNERIIGCDIGGTKTAVVLGDGEGLILDRMQFPTEPLRGFPAVYSDLTSHIRTLVQRSSGAIHAISVSIGGPLDIRRGIIKSPPHLPGWTDIPLKDMLGKDFGLPVYVEHDGNAGALAEWYFGAGRGFRNIIFITMGTGFGAGIILDGRLYRGTNDLAGEIGHVRIAEHGPTSYGKAGSLEAFGSGTGIAALARMMYPALWGTESSVADVYDAYRAGSVEALAVFDRAALHLGRGLAMLADTLNPERIILGGIGMRLTDALIEPAKRVFAEEALPAAQSVCQIVPAGLGEAIGDVASLCAAYEQRVKR